MGEKGREELGKADTPSKRGTLGDTWRPGRQDLEKAGTPSKKGKQEGRWETMEDTRRDKTLGRRTHHPTQTYIVGRHWEATGNKGRQDLGKAEMPSGRHTITGTHVGSQDVVKAGTPSNTGR